MLLTKRPTKSDVDFRQLGLIHYAHSEPLISCLFGSCTLCTSCNKAASNAGKYDVGSSSNLSSVRPMWVRSPVGIYPIIVPHIVKVDN